MLAEHLALQAAMCLRILLMQKNQREEFGKVDLIRAVLHCITIGVVLVVISPTFIIAWHPTSDHVFELLDALVALLRAKPTGLGVLFGSREIDFPVGGVEIADDKDRPSVPTQRLKLVEKPAIEVELEWDSRIVSVFAAPIRKIHVRHHDLTKVRDL